MMSDELLRERCRSNLATVRGRVADACHRAGREPAGVRIVGVTKYVPVGHARLLLEAGCSDLGESRPQGVWEKGAALTTARFHLIGPLQRNKVRRTLPLVDLIHTLDSLRLLESLHAEARLAGRTSGALVEVNLDGDPGRSGIPPAAVAGLLDMAAALDTAGAEGGIRILGLMGMASAPRPSDPADASRRQFALLRALRDQMAAHHPGLDELSMGMSGDFEDAILEGATIVRIGSALWEGMPTAATDGG